MTGSLLLAVSEATCSQIVEAAAAAVIVVDESGQIVLVNAGTERFFGYPREDLLGRTIECLVPERFRAVHAAQRQQFALDHSCRAMGAGFNLYGLRRDGTEFPVDVSLSPIQTEHGLLIVCAVRDITSRKIAEENTRRRDEMFHLLVNNIQDYGIIMLDPEGRVASWNAGALAITGYAADEALGKDVSIFYTSADIAQGKPQRELASAQATGRFVDENWRVHKDGTHFWAYVVVTACHDLAGNLVGFAKVTRDMTAAKRAEALVAAKAAELLDSNQELEAFAYSVSHDLRAPLRHIDGFAEMLQRHSSDQLDSQGKRYLEKIGASARRMGALIDDLLAFSRLMRADICRLPVDLHLLVEEVRHDLEPDCAGRTVIWINGNMPEVNGDRSMIRQVFINLLSNAVKYTRGRKEARIETGCEKTPDGKIAIFVRDNGAGFEMQYAGKLFGVFQRLHSDEFEGTGVGLATVKRIVERHGGRVWATAAVDQGATFYFTLPTAKGIHRTNANS